MNRFQNHVCIVTGAGSGIGRATAQRFASEGARLLIVDINTAHADETVSLIKQSGQGDALTATADVADPAAIRKAIQSALDKWGQIDILVNNAAMMTFDRITDLSESTWDKLFAVNLRSVFLFCKYAIPHMPAGSAIINISSVHAHESEPGVAPYASSKAAMEAFSRVLAMECQDQKIRVNCIAPGAVNTPMLWNNPNVKSGKEKIQGAVGEPEDLAAAIAFLASAEARFINGTTLFVDGGRLDIL